MISCRRVLTTRTIMTHTDAENEETAMETDVEVTPRTTPKVHPAVDPPICEACAKLDMTFCDPQCCGCKNVITNMDTTIAQIFAVIRQWTPQTQQNIKTLVHEILRRGANADDRDGLTDMTILQYAAKAGAHGIGDPEAAALAVQLLVDKGADVFIRCRWTNMTALHYAAYFDVPDVIRILLKASRCVDIESVCTEFDHGTPLHIAAINLALEAAKCLIQNGANPLCKDGYGRTALECLPDQAKIDKDSEMGKLVGKMRKMLSDAEPASPKQSPPNYDLVPSKVTLQSIGVKLGDRVIVGGIKGGTLRYCGPTEFAAGIWAGIELDESIGKNDGSVGNISYFQCPKNHGIFAPINKVTKEGNSFMRTAKTGRRSSSPQALRAVTHPKIDVSRVTAKVNTGLHTSSSMTSECTELEIGDRVLVAGQRKGTVKFIGETQFSPGTWYGIELDRSVGKNDGAVNGVRYFTCRPRRGVFAPISRLKLLIPGHLVGSNESIDSSASMDTWTDREKKLSGRQRGGSLSSLNLSSSPSKSEQNRPNSSNSGSHRRTSKVTSDSEQYLKVGMSCFCNNELGTIRYIGPTDFAEGIWLGVELRTPKGKNDGTVQGYRFFHCKPNHGLLVRPSKISVRGINGAKLLGDIHSSSTPNESQQPAS
ncbi:CAP-Gly domain-containing linker protein 4-like isoform X2 [Tubulanus polymorphus]|uniref:CAP-Gly domain-containing linker protein 4-like isoform X2 n=1 Tax=Tubulanus polymorphus TaxID=672921 RepID=UPI003DA49AB6